MNWWFAVITVALFVIVNLVVDAMRRHATAKRQARLDGWDSWTTERKLDTIRTLVSERIDQDGRRWRNAIIGWIMFIWFVPTSLALIGNASNKAVDAVEQSCARAVAGRDDARAVWLYIIGVQEPERRDDPDFIAFVDFLNEHLPPLTCVNDQPVPKETP